MKDFPAKVAKHLINDLLRYWKDHGKPCLMPPKTFTKLVYDLESNKITRDEYKQALRNFFSKEKTMM